MKSILYALKDVFKNFFHWRGRLSKKGYWLAWQGVFIVNVILFYLLHSTYDLYNITLYQAIFYSIILWNSITFFPMLFAAMRRYHDFGKAGWRAIIFGTLGKVFILFGIIIASFTILAIIFSAGIPVNMSAFYRIMAFSIIFIIVGAILCILNIKFLLQPSDSGENAYGKPNPCYFNDKKQK